MAFKFGRVSHINSIPLFCAEPPPDFEIVCAYPALLNEATARGEFDVCLISRWEYPKVSDKYFVLPNYCIGGDGEIMSVKLFSKTDISNLGGKKVFITEQTGTSSRAFAYLCKRKYGFNLFDGRCASIREADAAILIGNQALAFDGSDFAHAYDLGSMWKEEISLPMIYAVFVVRNEIFGSMAPLLRAYLSKSLSEFARYRQEWILRAKKSLDKEQSVDFPVGELERYYNCLKFEFDDATFKKSFSFVEENGRI